MYFNNEEKKPRHLITIFLLLLSLVLLVTSCGKNSSNRSERSGLAVLKFINTTAQDQADFFQPWEYGIAAMLTTDLEKTAMFNIVDRERLNDILLEQDLHSSGLVDPKTAVKVGKLVAAEYILAGTYMVVGDNLKMTAQVFSIQKGIQLGAVSATGKTNDFFLVEKDLFTHVTKTLRVMLDEAKRVKILREVETKSVLASLNNYSGEIAVIEARKMKKLGKGNESAKFLDNAKQKFRDALQYDPKYERAKKNLAELVMAIPMTL